jgi:putative transposase
MTTNDTTFKKNQYYVIGNRAIEGEFIYDSTRDYLDCLTLIRAKTPVYHVAVIAYCLLPDSYIFLLRQDGLRSISEFLSASLIPFLHKIDSRRGRKKSPLAAPAKSYRIENDSELLYLCRYIHSQPVRASLTDKAEEWPFSNYREWLGLRKGRLKDEWFILNYFHDPSEYKNFVEKATAEPEESIRMYVSAYS